MCQDFLRDMLESHPEPSPKLGMCLCGHQGIAGRPLCFVCLSNIYQECQRDASPNKEDRG